MLIEMVVCQELSLKEAFFPLLRVLFCLPRLISPALLIAGGKGRFALEGRSSVP